jgi:putative Mg2+ transporter-C (MgtC) family protein
MLAVMSEALPSISVWEVILRIAVAGLLGGLIGFEREYSDQPAGFRTHILVSLGAALFTIAGAYGVEEFFESPQAVVRFDPTRVAAQIVTGIGFLGAGAIIRQGISIRGLTTAAALWVTAAVGMASAFGYWTGAIATALMTVIALYGLKQVERMIFPRLRRGYTRFLMNIEPTLHLAVLADLAEDMNVRVESVRIIESSEEGRRLVTHLRLPPGTAPENVADRLSGIDGITSVDWTS